MIFLEIFWIWFQIGIFSIGGGYAALPIIKNMIVDNCGWLTVAQFADLVVIDEMAPGPLILNSATFVGTMIKGLPGAVIATIGCITGPTIMVFIIAYFYSKYKELPIIIIILNILRPAVVALIASAGLSIMILTFWGENGFSFDINSINYIAVCIFVIAFIVLRKYKLNPVLITIGCGILGGVLYTLV